MKKTKKVISVILAIIMMLSVIAPAYAGTLNVNDKTTVESIIQNDSLAKLVSSLITDVNGAKQNLTGTVLRLCFMFIDNESLQDAIGETEVVSASDGKLAKILVEWLNANLPEWTAGITEQSWYSTVADAVKLLGLTLNLKDINGVLDTLYSVCDKLSTTFKLVDGDLAKLDGSAIETVRYNNTEDSALKVIYSLFEWLADNEDIIATVIKGGLVRDGGLTLGNIFDSIIGDKLDKINTIIDNIPTFAKSYIYLLIDGNAEAGNIKDNPAGDWGTSAYAAYTADELIAAALIRLIRNDEVENTVSKSDCDAALSKNFYELLSENLEPLFENYDAAKFLNDNVDNVIKAITDAGISKAIFNTTITFTNDTFKEIFTGAKTTGVLGQFNNLLYKVCELALTKTEFTKLALVKGDNTNLNANLTKICRYILPLLANKTVSAKLGYDFTAFTAEAVKTMELKDMATAVLKLFFEKWFDGSDKFNKASVNAATSIADLAKLAVYYTATNEEWLNLKDVTFTAPTTKDNATEYILDTAARIGLGALNYNADDLYYTTSLNGTEGYEAIINEVTNWGINFIKGIPAVVEAADLDTEAIMYDDTFYKLNVILNELVDFSFYTNESEGTTFNFDIGMFIKETFLDNLYNFDLEGVLNCLKPNTLSTNSLYKDNVANSILQIVDRIITALFKTTKTETTKQKTVTAYTEFTATAKTCTTQKKYTVTSYDAVNGQYYAATATEATNATHTLVTVEQRTKAQCTCKEKVYTRNVCSVCGYDTGIVYGTATGNHTWKTTTTAATCIKTGTQTEKCTVCGKVNYTKTLAMVAHTYKNGKCTVCGAAEPSKTPTYTLGDVDNDAKLSASDARLALRASVGLENYKAGTQQFLAADADKDGSIKAADARLILRAAVGLEKLA